jgi:hypothetical protein
VETLFSNKNGGHIPFLVVVIEDLKNRDRKNVSIMTTLGEKAKEEKPVDLNATSFATSSRFGCPLHKV